MVRLAAALERSRVLFQDDLDFFTRDQGLAMEQLSVRLVAVPVPPVDGKRRSKRCHARLLASRRAEELKQAPASDSSNRNVHAASVARLGSIDSVPSLRE